MLLVDPDVSLQYTVYFVAEGEAVQLPIRLVEETGKSWKFSGAEGAVEKANVTPITFDYIISSTVPGKKKLLLIAMQI